MGWMHAYHQPKLTSALCNREAETRGICKTPVQIKKRICVLKLKCKVAHVSGALTDTVNHYSLTGPCPHDAWPPCSVRAAEKGLEAARE